MVNKEEQMRISYRVKDKQSQLERKRERESDLFLFVLLLQKIFPLSIVCFHIFCGATDIQLSKTVRTTVTKKEIGFFFSRFGVEAAIGYLAERDAYCGCQVPSCASGVPRPATSATNCSGSRLSKDSYCYRRRSGCCDCSAVTWSLLYPHWRRRAATIRSYRSSAPTDSTRCCERRSPCLHQHHRRRRWYRKSRRSFRPPSSST